MPHRLGIIGGGNMGSAIVRGAIGARVLAASEIIVAEVDAERRRAIAENRCATTDDPAQAASAEMLLLAVKPQAFPEVARAIMSGVGPLSERTSPLGERSHQPGPIAESKLVISIMAGISSAVIHHALGPAARIVRAMPNTPCQMGAGMTAIALGMGAQDGDEAFPLALFDALGRTVMVEEAQIYAVTAVSGSGPAYVFLLAEAMEQAAQQMGLTRATARELVAQTIFGAGRLLRESDQTVTDLRNAVTSPGGTTAAALAVMFEQELPEIIVEALAAARDRGIELNREGNRQ